MLMRIAPNFAVTYEVSIQSELFPTQTRHRRLARPEAQSVGYQRLGVRVLRHYAVHGATR